MIFYNIIRIRPSCCGIISFYWKFELIYTTMQDTLKEKVTNKDVPNVEYIS